MCNIVQIVCQMQKLCEVQNCAVFLDQNWPKLSQNGPNFAKMAQNWSAIAHGMLGWSEGPKQLDVFGSKLNVAMGSSTSAQGVPKWTNFGRK